MDPHSPRESGWRLQNENPSLREVHRSIEVPKTLSFWRKLLAFSGPGYLVAVGYMDPGNWATDLAGGSAFGYTLLSVILISNLMAILLQSLCAKLGIVTGRDLAQACRDHYSRPVARLSLVALRNRHLRVRSRGSHRLGHRAESAVQNPARLGRVHHRARCAGRDVSSEQRISLHRSAGHHADPHHRRLLSCGNHFFQDQFRGECLAGFVPQFEIIKNPNMLYVAIGILGATVMPHNLYLHSSIVQTRKYEQTAEGKREAIKFATLDSTVALMFALFINAAILIVSAATFHSTRQHNVAEIQDAYKLLSPTLGVTARAACLPWRCWRPARTPRSPARSPDRL